MVVDGPIQQAFRQVRPPIFDLTFPDPRYGF